ncbi:hypothetical protein R1sor_001194 [Riccia sorocarpa]|uniref:DUF4218 domain-containing protein n=1 Tax=Riccia sorocarpa TaxID=122646 RepID=A0ABD3GXN9_9MARC
MYFVKRYLRSLKDYVKQHAKMEGSLAERYLIAEAMFYGSETLARLDPSAPLNSLADKEDEREVGEVNAGLQVMTLLWFRETCHILARTTQEEETEL